MKPVNKIKKEILIMAIRNNDIGTCDLDTDAQISEVYNTLVDLDAHWDYENEFREGQEETDVEAPYSRNYETKSVARKMSDGSWVGWTYFYGGGKHGNPEEIEWMDDAYNLDCKEEEKLVVVKTWKKKA